MKRILALLLLPACTTFAPSPKALTPDAKRSAAATSTKPGEPAGEAELTVTIAPQAKAGTVQVRVRSRSEAPRAWLLEDASHTTVTELVLKGARGAVQVTTSQIGTSLSIAPEGPLEPPVELAYTARTKEGDAPDRSPCRFAMDADFAHFCGEQVLALPSRAEPIAIRLELITDGTFHKDAASSLGLADTFEGTRRVEDLRRAAYVFGNLTTAEFRGVEGNDHAASLGYVSFDPRWIGAESASFRSSVDRFFDLRRSPEDPSVGVVIIAGSNPSEPLSILRRTRGALVSADVSAPWTPSSRIRIAQLWAQRTMGGALWIGSRDAAEETRGLWFSEGMSRSAALFVLNEQGFVSPNDLAHGVNGLLATDALSPMHGASWDDLAIKAASTDVETRDEARRLLAVRGAILGLTVGSDGVRKTMRKLLEIAADKRADALGYDAFLATLRESTSAEVAQSFDESLRSGTLTPEKGLLAPCHQLKKATIAEFELGFEFGTDAAGLRAIRSVKAGSNAERAGLRVGDVLGTLDYRPGQPAVAVEGSFTRGTKTVKVRFLPQGRTAPGYEFERAPRAPKTCD